MKKQILILSMFALTLSLAACGKGGSDEEMNTKQADSEFGVNVQNSVEEADIGVNVEPAKE